MPSPCSFRQVEEKHVGTEVHFMVWSPKMDLLALANVQGEVVLHRLHWQKVWTLPPPAEKTKVTCLSWRPDGKVLAIGYSCAKVLMCDVENSIKLDHIEFECGVSTIKWIAEQEKTSTADNEEIDVDCFQENSAVYLPRLPSFPKTYSPANKSQSEENHEDAKRLKGQTDLNLMIVGTEEGNVFLYAYGVFPVGKIQLGKEGAGKLQCGEILSAQLTHDLNLLSLVVESVREDGQEMDVFNISFETSLLAARHRELKLLGLKFGQVLTLTNYLDITVQQMQEAWEDILMEMDSKLMRFAEEKQKVCGGSVSNDFLRLLMVGKPSDELQNFLLTDLTDKGLKKLGHSIETSYSNIQKLVLKHLQSVCQALLYHLSDIRGMSKWQEKFGVLGLDTDLMQKAVQTAGSFMLKASELQLVIDGSMKNLKAFFRWLYVVIKGLSDEPIPPELSKMTQQDIMFVAQFLKENFTEEMVEGKKPGFKLEKVGQYLKNEDLHDPPDNSENIWVKFLESSPHLKESSLLYPVCRTKSLRQIHQKLHVDISNALHKCESEMGKTIKNTLTTPLFTARISEKEIVRPRISQFSREFSGRHSVYTLYTCEKSPCGKCFLARQSSTATGEMEAVCLKFSEVGQLNDSTDDARCNEHSILDVAMYDDNTAAVLLQEVTGDNVPVLALLNLTSIRDEHFTPMPSQDLQCIDAGPLIDNMQCRRLEHMRAAEFAVSGTRKVSCVLFSNRRRVRLFEMDVEDEDEEEEEEESDISRDAGASANTSKLTETEETDTIDEEDENKENSKESAGMDL